MAEYDSKLSLMDSYPEAVSEEPHAIHCPSKKQSKEHAGLKDSRHEHHQHRIIFGFIVISVLFVAVFGVMILGVIYIQQVHNTINQLEKRVKILEEAFADSPCQNPKPLKGIIPGEKSITRHKRHNDDSEESPHVKKEHHGIAFFNIAWLHGGSKVDVSSTYTSCLEANCTFNLHQGPDTRMNCDGLLYKRSDGQQFCDNSAEGTSYNSYMTAINYTRYYYFAKAPWMTNRPESKRYFDLSRAGVIKVLKSGIYIVQASVHFVNMDSREVNIDPNFGIYKIDQMDSKTLLAQCEVPVRTNRNGVYPCLTWQLVSLRKDESIYLSIADYAWFRVDKETLHFALIRLNGEIIE